MRTKSDDKTECTGTARAIHELSSIQDMEDEYGPEAAVGIATTAIQRSHPLITKLQVEGAIAVHKALMTGQVDIEAERKRVEKHSLKVVPELLGTITKMKTSKAREKKVTESEDE